MRTVSTVAGAALALTGLSGCMGFDLGNMDRYHADFHYTYNVEPKARIDVEGFNGVIEVEGWDRNEVEVSGVKSASSEELRDAIKIDLHNTSDSVSVRAVKPSMTNGNMGVRFTLHVPRSAELDRITTSNAQIRIQNVSRAAHLKSSNGAIRITGVHGDVDAHTSNAAIEADSLDGSAVLKTSNGHIRVERTTGPLEAETTNNSINARMAASPATPVKLSSSNGAIELTMEQAPQGDIRATTSNSSITLKMPADTSARVTADTSNSSIRTEFEIAGDNEKRHVNGSIGTGAHAIELHTSNGRISILKGAGDSKTL